MDSTGEEGLSLLSFWLICIGLLFVAMAFVLWPIVLDKALALKTKLVISVLLGLSFPALIYIFYQQWGSYQQVKAYQLQQKQIAQAEQIRQQLGSITAIVNKLEQRVKHTPNDAQAWYWLGRLYLNMRRFPKAEQALANAYQLQPQQVNTMLAYVQAIMLNQHKLTKPAVEIIDATLSLQPENLMALNLKALSAYQCGNYKQAVIFWEKLLTLLPPGSSDEQAVLSAIAKAQKQLAKSH
jgi:cytochrome c-type biogenesis protein CcmH